MTSAGRSMVVVVVLAVASIVAIWPRDGEQRNEQSGGDVTASAGATRPAENTTGDTVEEDAALAELRERAATQPCPSPAPEAPAPAGPLAGVTAPCLGAPGTVDLGAALAGRATLLNLWASWCGPCREEMPVLASYAEQADAVAVLGVNVQEPAANGLTFLADIGVRYPSITDPHETVQKALRTPPVLPVSYLVFPDGSVERINNPLVFHSPDEVHAAVSRQLEQR